MHGHLELGVLPDIGDVDDVGVERVTKRVEMLDEVDQPTLVVEDLDALGIAAPVGECDLKAAVQECGLPQPRGNRVVIELGGLLECLRARPEANRWCPSS